MSMYSLHIFVSAMKVSLFRRAAISAAALGGSALSLSAVASSESDKALDNLWTGAVDGMIDAPGCAELSTDGVLYMAPRPAAAPAAASGSSSSWSLFGASKPLAQPEKVDWPKIFTRSVIFSLTAHNPMGREAPAAYNTAANQHLEREIAKLRNPVPRAWWHSFGFNVAEGWREDGFSVAFASEERAFARVEMLNVRRRAPTPHPSNAPSDPPEDSLSDHSSDAR